MKILTKSTIESRNHFIAMPGFGKPLTPKQLAKVKSDGTRREVSRRTGIDKSTCSHYLKATGGEIEFGWIGRDKVYMPK